jgi:hypothetical protein
VAAFALELGLVFMRAGLVIRECQHRFPTSCTV